MRSICLICCSVVLTTGLALAGPTTKPAGAAAAPAKDAGAGQDEDFVVSKMRVQEFKPQTYLYFETETTLGQIGQVARTVVEKLHETIKEANVTVNGPTVFVYQGASADPNKPFTLQVGMCVAPGTKEVGDFKVRELSKFKAATVIYSGPVAQIPQAYQQLYGDLFQAQLEPTQEMRDYYLYFESTESPNNVQILQVGIK